LEESRVANPDHVDVAAGGPAEIAQWRDMHPGVALDLSSAVLAQARFSAADLSGADLSGANLEGADLRGANLRGAVLPGASLERADLSDADLNGADLRQTMLTGADLSRADLSGADLSDADLSGVFAIDADFTGSRLVRVNLSSAHLTRAQIVDAELTDAVVENCIVTDTHVQRLRGRPRPPEVLWFDREPQALVTDSGLMLLLNDADQPLPADRAQAFFVEPQIVELVWERSFSDAALVAYAAFQAAARLAEGWPRDVRFLAGAVRLGRMVLLYEAPRAADVVMHLRELLEPFMLADFVDWDKTARAWSRATGESVSFGRPVRHDERRSLAGLLRPYVGFAENIPVELRANGQRVPIEFRAKPVSEPSGLGAGLTSETIDFGNRPVGFPEAGHELMLSIRLAAAQHESAGPAIRFAEGK
jgi:hypothetical protein